MKSGSVCICQKAVFAVARHPYGYQCKKKHWQKPTFVQKKLIGIFTNIFLKKL